MAFVLDKVDDMRIIYETAKRVYARELTIDAAVKEFDGEFSDDEIRLVRIKFISEMAN